MGTKLTKEIVNNRISGRGIFLLGEYVGSHTKSLFQCKDGHRWNATPANVMHSTGCPHCSGNIPLTTEIVNRRIADRGLVMLGEYVNNSTKAEFQCREGHTWMTTPDGVMFGYGCPSCGSREAGQKRRLTPDQIRDRLAGRGIVLLGDYETSNVKTRFQCDKGHTWRATPGSVLAGNGCPHCSDRFPLTKEIVNNRIADRGFVLLGDYVNSATKALFQCDKGHKWEVLPSSIMQGRGCPSCAGQVPLTKEIVNSRIADRGLRMLGEYVNVDTKTAFQCGEGHTWEAAPEKVMSRTGCPYCSGMAPLKTDIVNARIEDRGLVLVDEFINNQTKVRFKCSEGHIWSATPNSILNGRGCPDCAETGFNPSEPGILYYIAVTTDDGDTRYKIGITNLSVKERFTAADLARIRIVRTWRFAVGRVAAQREAEILYQYAGERYYGPDILVGAGNTELFTHDVLGLDRLDDENGQTVVDEDASLIFRPTQSDFDF